MAILSTIHKGYLRLKTVAGYVTILPRTLASLVEMKNGKSVEDAVTELDNKVKEVKVIAKDEFAVVIDTGYSHIRIGTAIRPTAVDSGGKKYVQLWSVNEIATLLQVPKVNAQRLGISIYNGDGVSNSQHLYTPEFWNDILYVYSWNGVNGNIRINYRMEYPTIGV